MHDLNPSRLRARFALHAGGAAWRCALLHARCRRAAAGRRTDAPLVLKPSPHAAARRSPSRRAEQLPTFVVGRPHVGPAPTWRPWSKAMPSCAAATPDPCRPAGVLPARRPGQGARQCAHQPRRQRLRRPGAGAQARGLRRLLQQAALPLPGNDALRRGRPRSTSSTTSASVVRNATYTTCQREPGPSWMPDWILQRRQLQHRHRGRSRPGRAARVLQLHGRADPAGARHELSAQRQAQVGPAAAHHRPGQRQRRRAHACPTTGTSRRTATRRSIPS